MLLIQGNSYLSFTIEEDPKTQTKPEGSRMELKCRVKGEKEVFYKWFKDEEELPEEKSSCLIRDPLKVKHFGSYRCEVSSCDADRNSSSAAELDVAPSDGRSELIHHCVYISITVEKVIYGNKYLFKHIMLRKQWFVLFMLLA